MEDTNPDQEQLCLMATIANMRGLHARAAAKFVKLVESYKSEITVTRDEMSVSGRSIMGLMMLAATKGTEIRISSTGPDALAALEAVSDLIKRKFDEE